MPITNNSNFDFSQILPFIGGIGALGGGLAQAGAQNNSASLAQQYAAMASQLGGFGLGTGPGGVNVTGNPLGAGGSIGLGGFNPAYLGLAGVAGNNAGTAGGIGSPFGLNPALQGAFNTAAGGIGGINPGAIGGASNANLFAAQGLAGGLGGGFPAQVAAQYNALQQLQSPANINAANSLGNSLFGRGMLGSSSGGILGQQFGQGLAQQSAANAAQATGLGIQALGTQANAATGLTWMGSNALNSAFSNFGNASMLAPNVQSSYLNPALAGITGAGNLTNTGLGLYNAGLQSALGQNQAAARAGYLGTTNANSPNQQSPYGQLLGNMFGGLAQGGNPAGGGILQQIFGGGQGNSGGILGQLFGYNGPMSGPNGGFAMSPGSIAQTYANAGVGSGAAVPGFGGLDTSGWSTTGMSDIGNYGMDPSIFGPSAAGGEAATVPTGAGAGVGNMIMPSTTDPALLSAFAGQGGSGYLAGLGTAADTTGMSDIGAYGASSAGGGAGAGSALAGLGFGAAAIGGLYGLDQIFQNNSQVTNPGMAAINNNNAAGALAAANASYNQPGMPWQPAGWNPQQVGQSSADAFSQLAQLYASGALNPNGNLNMGGGPANPTGLLSDRYAVKPV